MIGASRSFILLVQNRRANLNFYLMTIVGATFAHHVWKISPPRYLWRPIVARNKFDLVALRFVYRWQVDTEDNHDKSKSKKKKSSWKLLGTHLVGVTTRCSLMKGSHPHEHSAPTPTVPTKSVTVHARRLPSLLMNYHGNKHGERKNEEKNGKCFFRGYLGYYI